MDYIMIFLSLLLVIVNTDPLQSRENIGESCDHGFYWDDNSHQCQSCPFGYFGPNCSLACRYPSYGERCQQKCNCTKEYCISDSGCVISSNCEPGYYWRDCSLTCRYPNYGDDCQSQCDCNMTLCNHITGCQSTTDGATVSESTLHILSEFPSSSAMFSTMVSEENGSKLPVFTTSLTVTLWFLGFFLFVSSICVISNIKHNCDKRKRERVAREGHTSDSKPCMSLRRRSRTSVRSGYIALWRSFTHVNRRTQGPDMSGHETLRSDRPESYVSIV